MHRQRPGARGRERSECAGALAPHGGRIVGELFGFSFQHIRCLTRINLGHFPGAGAAAVVGPVTRGGSAILNRPPVVEVAARAGGVEDEVVAGKGSCHGLGAAASGVHRAGDVAARLGQRPDVVVAVPPDAEHAREGPPVARPFTTSRQRSC